MKRAALIIPINSGGEILLQHKDSGHPVFPNTWCLFGGGIEEGETPEQAIVRELKEELELSLSDYQKVYEEEDEVNEIIRYVFTTYLDTPAEILKKTLHEGDDLAWFSANQIDEANIVKHHLKIIHFYLKSTQKNTEPR